MQTVTVRNLTIGDGKPKICVPITGTAREEILEEARALTSVPSDMAEWRIDWFEDVSDFGKVRGLLEELREILGEMPLLLTFRTYEEGGKRSIEKTAYAELCIAAARTGLIDLLDVELFSGDETVREIIENAHREGVKVIASNHDFSRTPARKEIVRRLCLMQDLGADILKIAVMPSGRNDVLELLAATLEMSEQHAGSPVVTMSMGSTGVLSRITGEFFGSAITFGTAGKASAPGQIEAPALAAILDAIHDIANR